MYDTLVELGDIVICTIGIALLALVSAVRWYKRQYRKMLAAHLKGYGSYTHE